MLLQTPLRSGWICRVAATLGFTQIVRCTRGSAPRVARVSSCLSAIHTSSRFRDLMVLSGDDARIWASVVVHAVRTRALTTIPNITGIEEWIDSRAEEQKVASRLIRSSLIQRELTHSLKPRAQVTGFCLVVGAKRIPWTAPSPVRHGEPMCSGALSALFLESPLGTQKVSDHYKL